MPGKLYNKVCLISGSTGIAAATAELAIREDASVFFASRTADHCHALAKALRAQGGTCDFCVADLTHPASASEVVSGCLSLFGRIDALFNVAGISGRKFGDGPIHECTEEGWDITLDTNVKSMFLLCRATIGHMLTQTLGSDGLRGTILNMASVLAFSPEPKFFGAHAYCASKGAILGLSKAMAAYYAPWKIRVNVIAPALVRTPMSVRSQTTVEILDFMKTKQPLCQDLIQPEEVARAAVFLLSEDSRNITGDILTIDAGWSLSG
jgi:NAD(P)-dependent dehydrogenase (short-subunit alcohol dehydrogenase family)